MRHDRRSLLSLTLAAKSPARFIADSAAELRLCDLEDRSCLDVPVEDLRGKTVLLATQSQLPSVLAVAELDGIAGRVLLATPDALDHLSWIIAEANVDVLISDAGSGDSYCGPGLLQACACKALCRSPSTPILRGVDTEWVLFTSGTTGRPKMVVHTLLSLTGPLNDGVVVPNGAVWSTFYDVRRYGGLQIVFRALVGGGSLVLSDASESMRSFLTRLRMAGVTHLSGTPSHWRAALMNGAGSIIQPTYVRLSGEVADQSLLNNLRRTFQNASIAHAFASTEAGVAFDVRDGLAGFPASFLSKGPVEMRVFDGTLHIRSSRTSSGYLGHQMPEKDGFIDTGDLVEQRGDRLYFAGRKEGVINVGGLKVFPEEVEAVINRHPSVQMTRVWPRKNPITGAIVAADIVAATHSRDVFETLCGELGEMCRAALAPHKIPTAWRKVNYIEMTSAGKVRRA